MGLLDDAIRDHLELKRLSGADPGLVAREQKEALDPVFGEELPAPDGDIAIAPNDVPMAPEDEVADAPEDDIPMAGGGLDPEDDRETSPVRARAVGDPDTTPQPARPQDFSSVGQETAELDMRTVLDEHPGDAPKETSPEGPAIAGPVGGSRSVEDRDEDSLEWEVPEKDPHGDSVEAG
jgi:hypothetical protein